MHVVRLLSKMDWEGFSRK